MPHKNRVLKHVFFREQKTRENPPGFFSALTCSHSWAPENRQQQLTGKKYMGVSKNRGKTPKMDGENNGSKPY